MVGCLAAFAYGDRRGGSKSSCEDKCIKMAATRNSLDESVPFGAAVQ